MPGAGAGLESKPDEALHLSRGNSLLAGLGAYGREFYELLLESPCSEHELFAEETECKPSCLHKGRYS